MRIDNVFILLALVFLLIGMAFGGWMGAKEDFTFAPAHAHWNLVGFVTSALYGLILRAYPALQASRLAWPQCIAHFVGTVIFTWGLMTVESTGTFLQVQMIGPALVILAALMFLVMFAMRAGLAATDSARPNSN